MEIDWSRIKDFRVCDEATAFSFEYIRDEVGDSEQEQTEPRKTKYVRLETGFVSFFFC